MVTPAITARPNTTYILKYQMNLDITSNLTIDFSEYDKPRMYQRRSIWFNKLKRNNLWKYDLFQNYNSSLCNFHLQKTFLEKIQNETRKIVFTSHKNK